MANSKYSLFPNSTIDREKVQIYPCTLEFSAPIEAGMYVFKSAPIKFGHLPMGMTGVIAGVMLSANCSPDDFAAAVDEPLQLQVYHGQNRTPVNLSPFYFSQFAHGDNFTLDWKITGSTRPHQDDILLGVSGNVNQIADMDENELRLKISFNFMRVDNKEIARMRNTVK